MFLASSTLFLGFLLAIVKNQVESTVLSLWACLCNLKKQVAPRFCGTIPRTSKSMLIFLGRVYFLFGLVSAILMSNLLPNYVAPVYKVLKIS